MTQYFEDWRGNTDGAAPIGWTRRFTTSGTYSIVANPALASGYELRVSGGSNTGKILSMDAVDADPARADAEVLFMIHRQVSNSQELGAVIRATGATQATGSYYRAAWTSGSVLRISKRINGAWTLLGSFGRAISVGNSSWIRFRVNGDRLQAKIWPPHEAEPSGWNIDTTDTDLTDPGWVGTFSYDPVPDGRFRFFGIGTGGQPAPMGWHSHSEQLLNSPTGGASPLDAGPFPIYAGHNQHRYLLVAIPYEDGGTKRQITGVTYAGLPMEFVGERRSTTGVAARESLTVYGLANPPIGTGNVVVTYTGTTNVDIAVAATQYSFPWVPEIADVLTAESQVQRDLASVDMTLGLDEVGWFSSCRNDGNYYGSGYGVEAPLIELAKGAVHNGSTTGFVYALGQAADGGGTQTLRMWCQDGGADDDSVIVAVRFKEGTGGGGETVTPESGTLSLAGFAPSIAASENIALSPDVAALGLTGHAPAVIASAAVDVKPGAGALSLAGHASVVALSDNVAVLSGTGAISLAGHAPHVRTTDRTSIHPRPGHLALAGHAPAVVVTDHIEVAPATGSLTIAGHAPAVNFGVTVTAGSGDLSLAGHAPSIDTTANVVLFPGAGRLVTAGYAPSILGAEQGSPGGDDAPLSAADLKRWKQEQKRREALQKSRIEETAEKARKLRETIEDAASPVENVEKPSRQQIKNQPDPETGVLYAPPRVDGGRIVLEIEGAAKSLARRREEDELLEILLLVA